MRGLAQVMLQRRIAQIGTGSLQLLNILRHAQVALLLILQLLHVEIGLHLVRIIVKILIDLLFSRGIILTYSHFRIWTLILECWIDSNLITEDRLVLSMLHTHLFVVV